MTRKDVQDQLGSIQYPARQFILQIPKLCRRKVVIEQDDIGAVSRDGISDFFDLAFADQGSRIWCRTPLHHFSHDVSSGAAHQFAELLHRKLCFRSCRRVVEVAHPRLLCFVLFPRSSSIRCT